MHTFSKVLVALTSGGILAFTYSRQGSNWTRYVSNRCPAVSGRSSLMDKDGLLEPLPGCALDPTYKISASDWQQAINAIPLFQWRAGNVLASLEVSSWENSGEVAWRFPRV